MTAQRNRLVLIVLAGVMLAVVVVVGLMGPRQGEDPPDGQGGQLETTDGTGEDPKGDPLARADQLYAQHCAACHGEKGNGDGLAARFLFPRPRNFQAGNFRLVSTTNGVPTTDDLIAVLKRGMPGSSMPPWPQLGQDDARLLAERVMRFRSDAIGDARRKEAAEFDEEVDEDDLNELVASLTTPGAAVEVPPIPQSSAESVDRGRELYLTKGCADCHGKTGKGDGQQKQVDAEGLPTRPRDLTMGVFKGSPDARDVYIRTQAGMPGSPMPASAKLTHEEISDMVHFVRSLSDEATRAATVLNREKLTASHVNSVPVSPNDQAWQQVEAESIRLTPLWWRDEFPRAVDVQLVHDGTTIAMRLSWPDPEPSMHAAKSEAFEDAVGIELYRGDAEPFLGMGAKKSQLEVWMWDADRQFAQDVDDVNPQIVVDQYPFSETVVDTAEYKRPGTATAAQPDISLPARASGNRIVPGTGSVPAPATTLETAGPGTVTFRPPISQLVKAEGSWTDGRWSVVLTRPLAVEDGQAGVLLKPGERVSVAFAVWDGSQRDRNGKKLVTIWQELTLEK